MTTRLLLNTPEGISQAASLLHEGACVAFPTETVYGLGADATSDAAVAGIYAAKERPSFNPLIVHLSDPEAAKALVHWSDTAETLAKAFWPGAMTLVLPLRDAAPISNLVTAGLPSLAIRIPAHPTARALLQQVARPIAAPSANPSGKLSSVTAEHVKAGLEGRIAAVLDGGPCPVGLESTIIGLTGAPALLRPGGIAHEAIEHVLGHPLAAAGAAITAPGQLTSHYAPNAALRLNAPEAMPGEIYIGFGSNAGELTLSTTGNLAEAAARLFLVLHEANEDGRPIAVAPIPEDGVGRAINDRLRRAAAPRD